MSQKGPWAGLWRLSPEPALPDGAGCWGAAQLRSGHMLPADPGARGWNGDLVHTLKGLRRVCHQTLRPRGPGDEDITEWGLRRSPGTLRGPWSAPSTAARGRGGKAPPSQAVGFLALSPGVRSGGSRALQGGQRGGGPARPQLALPAQVLPHRAREEHVRPGGLRLLPHPAGVSSRRPARAERGPWWTSCPEGRGPSPPPRAGDREKMRKRSRPRSPGDKPTRSFRREDSCALHVPLPHSKPRAQNIPDFPQGPLLPSGERPRHRFCDLYPINTW